MKDITKTTPLPRLLPLQMANVSTAGLAQLVFTVSIWTGTNFGARILEGRKSVPVSEKGVHPVVHDNKVIILRDHKGQSTIEALDADVWGAPMEKRAR
jgi:hypothetical protein